MKFFFAHLIIIEATSPLQLQLTLLLLGAENTDLQYTLCCGWWVAGLIISIDYCVAFSYWYAQTALVSLCLIGWDTDVPGPGLCSVVWGGWPVWWTQQWILTETQLYLSATPD